MTPRSELFSLRIYCLQRKPLSPLYYLRRYRGVTRCISLVQYQACTVLSRRCWRSRTRWMTRRHGAHDRYACSARHSFLDLYLGDSLGYYSSDE